jgi:hypothetical protein
MEFVEQNLTLTKILIMASSSETGHLKNVTAFENLIGLCTGLGASYNPVKPALKLTALNTLLTDAKTALQNVKAASTALKNATNVREMAFKPLKALATKVVGALAASEAMRLTVDDAKSINLKIQGRRASLGKKATEETAKEGEESPKRISASQQSFDRLIDHFALLIQALTIEPKYDPNENELKVVTLNAVLADLKAKNTDAVNAADAMNDALIARDKLFYAKETGLCDIGLDVRNYAKSLLGASSPKFKQIRKLSFRNRPKD